MKRGDTWKNFCLKKDDLRLIEYRPASKEVENFEALAGQFIQRCPKDIPAEPWAWRMFAASGASAQHATSQIVLV